MPPRQTQSVGAGALKRLVGDNVRQRRLRLGLAADELAAKAGISPKQLSRIEAGTANPSVRLLGLLAEVLDATVVELLTGSGPQ